MYELLFPVYWVIDTLISLFVFVVIVRMVMSWLFAFDVVNRRNRIAWSINDMSIRITDPVMRPIQRVLPPLGGLDLSPLVIVMGAFVIQWYLRVLFVNLVS